MPSNIDRRHVVARAVAAAASFAAVRVQAQPAERSFSVVSEMARMLSIVIFQETTGTRLDSNLRQLVPMKDGAFELLSLRATRAAIVRAVPVAPVSLVSPLAEDLFPRLARAAVGDDAQVPADLHDVLKQHGSKQLLVWTRLRSNANIRGRDTLDLGSGQLEGVGLYLDRFRALTYDAGRSVTGFIAPYLHARATLIDIASGKVRAFERVEASEIYTILNSRRSGAGNVDEAFDTDEKLKMMSDLVTSQIDQVVPALLARS